MSDKCSRCGSSCEKCVSFDATSYMEYGRREVVLCADCVKAFYEEIFGEETEAE